MPSAVRLREDYSAEELRTLARRSKDVSQSRRLLSLAAVRDGMDRAAAAKIGGMDRQTLRDWVHRFNVSGPEGLVDNRTEGPKPRLSEEQLDTSNYRVSFASCESVEQGGGIGRFGPLCLAPWAALSEAGPGLRFDHWAARVVSQTARFML
jgi:Winged helix-turn helix